MGLNPNQPNLDGMKKSFHTGIGINMPSNIKDNPLGFALWELVTIPWALLVDIGQGLSEIFESTSMILPGPSEGPRHTTNNEQSSFIVNINKFIEILNEFQKEFQAGKKGTVFLGEVEAQKEYFINIVNLYHSKVSDENWNNNIDILIDLETQWSNLIETLRSIENTRQSAAQSAGQTSPEIFEALVRLGFERDDQPTPELIKKNHRERAQVFHEDKHFGAKDEFLENMKKEMQKINDARDLLLQNFGSVP